MKKSKDISIKVNVEFTEDFEVTNCEKIEKEIFFQFCNQLKSEFGRIVPRNRFGDQMLWGLRFHYMPFAARSKQ